MGRNYRNSKALAWRLHEIAPFMIIYVTRGGLVPAAVVARELDIRLIDTICVISYKDHSRGEVEFLKKETIADKGENWLIVDDLADSGETIKALRPQLPNAHYATVYAKPDGRKAGRHLYHRSFSRHMDSLTVGFGNEACTNNK